MSDAAAVRFPFGLNWASFADRITEGHIAHAELGLKKLFPNDEIRGATFLDIGCGAGLSMVAAMRLGARRVHGIDIDHNSAAAARYTIGRFGTSTPWSLEVKDVFDCNGGYDVTYSWGVLHHTGGIWRALAHACALVPPSGLLAVALYRKTPLCSFWAAEKRIYSTAGEGTQRIIRTAYKIAYLVGIAASGRNPIAYVRDYSASRGMRFHHDIHDWLGGYPYESAEPREVEEALTKAGLSIERSFQKPAAARGLFGSHCDEYVARRSS
jgi:2-polyprenyl-6-hydroxyphenyl methylase/3-demethylubiquinone-9 3-methyltransferase